MSALQLDWNPFDQADPGPCVKIILMNTEDTIRAGRAIGWEYPPAHAVTALLDTGSGANLARLMSVTETAIYYWEHGKFEPSKVVWASFCRVRQNYRRKMKRLGKDLDGGPVMGDKS
jgi:hypothetical protein